MTAVKKWHATSMVHHTIPRGNRPTDDFANGTVGKFFTGNEFT
jgi:hypothetical protein